jgi:hypothetical protein
MTCFERLQGVWGGMHSVGDGRFLGNFGKNNFFQKFIFEKNFFEKLLLKKVRCLKLTKKRTK